MTTTPGRRQSGNSHNNSGTPISEPLRQEFPAYMDMHAHAAPPKQHQSENLEGTSLYVNNEDACDVSTVTFTGGGLSLDSSVLNPMKKVIPNSKPVDVDQVSLDSSVLNPFQKVIPKSKPVDVDQVSRIAVGDSYEDNPDTEAKSSSECCAKVTKREKMLILFVLLLLVVIATALGVAFGNTGDDGGSGLRKPNGTQITVTLGPTMPSATSQPSTEPTVEPLITPTGSTPSPTPDPTSESTVEQTSALPVSTPPPTPPPSVESTDEPTSATPITTTASPTPAATTPAPTTVPSTPPSTPSTQITNFYVMGSQTNDPNLAGNLAQISTENIDWLVHVGDFSNGECSLEAFQEFDQILKECSVPVFVLPGENEWNNCDDPDRAWNDWTSVFDNYHTKYWDPPTEYAVSRQTGGGGSNHVEHNFAFRYQRVLHVGINLVGGRVHNREEWTERLEANMDWIFQNAEAHRGEFLGMAVYGNSGFENEDDLLKSWYETLEERLEEQFGDNSLPIAVAIYETSSVPNVEFITEEEEKLRLLKFRGGFWPSLWVNFITEPSNISVNTTWLSGG